MGTTPSGVSKSLHVSDEPAPAVLVGHAQDHERVGLRSLHQLPVRPGVDRAAALEVDVRAQDAAEARRGGRRRRSPASPAPFWLHEELLELRAERPERRRIGTARQRRRPPARFAVLLVEHREGRPVDDHRLIEAPDQILQFLHRHELPVWPEHPCLDLHQRRLAVEMSDDVGIAVERDQDRLRDDARRILQHDERPDPGARSVEPRAAGASVVPATSAHRLPASQSGSPPAPTAHRDRGSPPRRCKVAMIMLPESTICVKHSSGDPAAGWRSTAAATRAEQSRGSVAGWSSYPPLSGINDSDHRRPIRGPRLMFRQ